ncbi:MAG TPA: hypothetical protein VFT87_01025 [Candidatus Saccharimonadales bacterium]|nr:hypothetical protein [Candidatus Saccharimonadales bacterium]
MTHGQYNELSNKVSHLDSEVGGLKKDVSGLKKDVSELKKDVGGLKKDVSELKTDFRSLSVQFEDMSAKIDTVLEIVVPMHKDLTELKNRYNEDIPAMKADLALAHSHIYNHELRITKLEAHAV